MYRIETKKNKSFVGFDIKVRKDNINTEKSLCQHANYCKCQAFHDESKRKLQNWKMSKLTNVRGRLDIG